MDQQVTGIKGVKISNWSDTFSCCPELYFIPRNVEELREILLLAKSNGKKVRVVGRGHSPSDLPFTNDYLISLEYFNTILEVNEEKSLVKVEAGITISQLNSHLDRHGLALSVLGSVSDLTLAGIISTATHGSGIKYRVNAAYVTELELLTSSGDLVKCSREEKPEVFNSALCGLGAIGVLVSATIQCEPAFNLHEHVIPATLDEVLEDLDEHLAASEHFRFYWVPHTNLVAISHASRVYDIPATKLTVVERMVNWIWNYGVGYYVTELSYWISTYFPRITPYINRLAFYAVYGKPVQIIDKSYRVFNFECRFKQYVNEWSIPVEKTAAVMQNLRRFIDANPDIVAHFGVEVRFVRSDDIYLSPASGRDSCYINIIVYRPYGKHIEHQKYWDGYEKMMRDAGGRPHWAKAHRETAVDFVKMYPYFRAWAQVRKRMDPINMFMNDYLDRIYATFPKD
ncbi:L-gulonolactone oxidase [Halotydeus destructor]|nr:L-gulonolactone oxidase [Halotydeus destructor]